MDYTCIFKFLSHHMGNNQKDKYAVENAKDGITKLQELNSALVTVPLTIEIRKQY